MGLDTQGHQKKSNIEFGGAGVWSLASNIEFRGMGVFGHWHLEIAGTEVGTSRIHTGVAILFPPTVSKFRENVINHITKSPWIAFLSSFRIHKESDMATDT